MALPTSARPHTARRLLAGLAIAAFAFTGCNLTSGETTVEASAPADPPAEAPTESSAPAPTPEPTAVPTSATAPDGEPTRGERAETAATDEEELEALLEELGVEELADTPSTPTDLNIVSDEDCLQGVWQSEPGQFGAYIDRVAELTGAALSATGTVELAFEDGLYIYSVMATTSIDVDGFQTLSVVDGITRGSYDLTTGFVIAEQTWAEIDAYIELPDGTRLDAGVLGEEFNQLAAFHEAPYDCNGPDSLTMHFDTQPGRLRFPMAFTRP